MEQITPREEQNSPDKLRDLQSEHKQLLDDSIPENTKKTLRYHWKYFISWCKENNRNPLPADPQTVVLYLTDIKDQYKSSTLKRRAYAISSIHNYMDEESPVRNPIVRQTLQAIQRVKQDKTEKKEPLLTDNIVQICSTLGNRLIDIRDRSILLLAYASGSRRSEIVALNVEDIEIKEEGLAVEIRRSKTDQEGKGRKVGIAYGSNPSTCPVRSYKKWLEASGIQEGAVFRTVDRHGNLKDNRLSAKAVTRIVKKHAERIGLDPDQVSSHSLRSGLVTQSAMKGVSMFSIMEQTGHKSESVVREYYRPATIFQDNASSKLGL